MPIPSLRRSDVSVADIDADAFLLVLPPLTDEDPLAEWPGLHAVLRAVGFTGAAGSLLRVPAPETTPLPLWVVGSGAAPTSAAVRDAVAVGIRGITGFARVAVATRAPEHATSAAEGAVLGGYRFADYKRPKKDASQRAAEVVLLLPDDAEADLAHAVALGEAVSLVKDLVTTPAEWLGPDDLAQRAVDVVADLPVTVEVYDEAALEAGGFGGILGVGQGSDRPPRAVRLDYAPAGSTRHVALVGKGITFDTGGLSLKPAASMVGMKYDMCGAATALAVVRAAAALALPIHVTAWLCIADNMPSGRATRPGDVLRTRNGTTVEVLNTDAEGRLVLADGLAAASEEHPDLIVDIATLTGAITVALGTRHVGVFGDDDSTAHYLAAAEAAGELAWRLPLPAHMEDELDSPIADLQNAKIGDPAGGSLFAGLFLQRFIGRTSDDDGAPRIPWIHLDIAGVGMNKGAPYGATDRGPTGATVRSLLALLRAEGDR